MFKAWGLNQQSKQQPGQELEQILVFTFKEYYELSGTGSNKLQLGFLKSKTNLMMSEYTYLFNLAIKSFNKLFNSATYRQAYASLREMGSESGENSVLFTSSARIARAFRFKF